MINIKIQDKNVLNLLLNYLKQASVERFASL